MEDDDFDDEEDFKPSKTVTIIQNDKNIEYTDPECVRFVQDMEEAGLEVEHYHGRFFWYGPAVRVDGLQEAYSNTKVPCQSDNLGHGFIVYPVSRDEGIITDEPTI